MEDLARYLDEIVRPTIADFESEPTSVRLGFLACVVTFHGVDYLAHNVERSANLRQVLRRESPDFAIVDDIAHALKHVVVGNPNDPRLQAAEVIRRPPARLGELVLGLSRLGDAVGGVTLASDPTVDVLQVVKAAERFLETKAGPG